MLVQRGRTLKKVLDCRTLLDVVGRAGVCADRHGDVGSKSSKRPGNWLSSLREHVVVDLQCGAGPGRCFHHGLHVRADRCVRYYLAIRASNAAGWSPYRRK